MRTYSQKTVNNIEVFSTFYPLNRILQLVGLSCVFSIDKKLKCYTSTLKVTCILIILFVFNCLSFYYKFPNFTNVSSAALINNFYLFIIILDYFQYFINIYFVYKYGKESHLKYLNNYVFIDNILHTYYIHGRVKSSINKTCVFFLVLCSIISIADFITWFIIYNSASVSYILYYVYAFLQLFSSLDFIANCTQVLYRLQTIGDELQYRGRESSNLSVLYGETVDDVLIKKNQLKTNSSRAVAKPIHRQNIVNIVTGSYRCYLLLIDQSSYINKVFGFRVSVLKLKVNYPLMELLKRNIVGYRF